MKIHFVPTTWTWQVPLEHHVRKLLHGWHTTNRGQEGGMKKKATSSETLYKSQSRVDDEE